MHSCPIYCLYTWITGDKKQLVTHFNIPRYSNEPITEEFRMAWAQHTYWNPWTTTPNPARNSRSVNSIACPILWWSPSSTKPIHRISAMNLTKPIFAEAYNCTCPSHRSRFSWLYVFMLLYLGNSWDVQCQSNSLYWVIVYTSLGVYFIGVPHKK